MTGKRVDVLNFTKNCGLIYRPFDEMKISTDGYTYGDRVYSAWNNGRKLREQKRKAQICRVPDECESCQLTHHAPWYSGGLC